MPAKKKVVLTDLIDSLSKVDPNDAADELKRVQDEYDQEKASLAEQYLPQIERLKSLVKLVGGSVPSSPKQRKPTEADLCEVLFEHGPMKPKQIAQKLGFGNMLSVGRVLNNMTEVEKNGDGSWQIRVTAGDVSAAIIGGVNTLNRLVKAVGAPRDQLIKLIRENHDTFSLSGEQVKLKPVK